MLVSLNSMLESNKEERRRASTHSVSALEVLRFQIKGLGGTGLVREAGPGSKTPNRRRSAKAAAIIKTSILCLTLLQVCHNYASQQ